MEKLSKEVCTCGVPNYLHATCCGWANANIIIDPKTDDEKKYQELAMAARGYCLSNIVTNKIKEAEGHVCHRCQRIGTFS